MPEILNRLTGEVLAIPEGIDAEREQRIVDFAWATSKYEEARNLQAETKARLLTYASEIQLAGRKSGFLESSLTGIKLQMQFRDNDKWDVATMQEAEAVLGDKFHELFDIEVKYKPKRRALNQWLATQSGDNQENAAREIIRNAKIEGEQSQPYIKVVTDGTT